MKTTFFNIILNKIKNYLTIAIIAPFIFNACIKEIDFDEGILDSKLVVNGFVCPDSTIKVQLAISKPIPGVKKRTEWIDNATIKLFVDGVFTEELQNFELTYENDYYDYYDYYRKENPTSEYRSTQTIAQTGKTYKIEVEHPDFDKAWAETTIPEAIAIDSFYSEIREITEYNYTEERQIFHIKFTDPENVNNYYRLNYTSKIGHLDNYYWDEEKQEYTHSDSITIVRINTNNYINTDDPILVGKDDADDFLSMDADNRYNLFTDDLIDGQSYELSFDKYYYDMEIEKGEFISNKIQLMSLSKEAFLYIKSSFEHSWNDGEFLTEPVQVYSNINNGIGIFAGYSYDEYTHTKGDYPIDSVKYTY